MTDTEYRDQLLANFRALDRKTADGQATIWFDVIQDQDRRIADLSKMLDQAYLENAHLLARLGEIDCEHKARIANLEQELARVRYHLVNRHRCANAAGKYPTNTVHCGNPGHERGGAAGEV